MKDLLRMQNLAKRNTLSKKQVEEKSRAIEEALSKLPEFEKAKNVLLYFGVKNEVETKALIEKALLAGKRVVLPETDFGKRTITLREIEGISQLKQTRYGLLEPKQGKEVPASEIDLIVLPGVAFDSTGTRLGRGHGFYDSLLMRVSPKVPLIGLCFEENLEEKLPCESHDVKMNIVVTDKNIIRCGR